MSLQVWLPLNGDLHNQGLDGKIINTSNSGAVINNNGKIGKCYSFDGVDDWIQWSINKEDYGNKPISFCCWFKSDLTKASGTILDLAADLCLGYSYSSNTINFNYWRVYGTSSARSGDSNTISNSFNANMWHHITAVFDDTTNKIYVDGILQGTWQSKSQKFWEPLLGASYNKFSIGKSAGSSIWVGGLINDVRIYDHTLSDKEVEEIAKGLILHYKLDNNGEGSRNLLLGTYNFANWYLQSRWTKNNNIATYIEGSKVWHDMDSPTIPWTDVQGKTLTISADIRSDDFNYTDGSGFSICFVRKVSGPDATGYSTRRLECTPIHLTVNQITSEWKKYSATVANISDSSFNLTFNGGGGDWFGVYIWNYTNKSIQIKNIKLEIGNKATYYSQAPEDFGLDGNIVYDSSGYEHYGELYNYDTNGSITIVSDSPRYNVSTFINSTNNTTNTASGTRYIYGHCALTNPTTMSVAFWCKPVAGYGGGTGQGQFCTTTYEFGSTNVGSDYQASAMNHRDSAVDINDSASTTQCRPAFSPTANEWHHYVITYDGQNGKVYKDGVQSSTASFSAAKTLDSFIGVVIGFSKAGGVWRSNQSYFSDFRVYVTALTADQIAELYHTSASIDNKGNLYARELVEN